MNLIPFSFWKPSASGLLAVLGDRLLMNFTSNFAGGLWIDDINAERVGRTVEANRLTASTTTGGSFAMANNGSAAKYLTADDPLCAPSTGFTTWANAPAFGSAGPIGTTGQRMACWAFRSDALIGNDYQFFSTFAKGTFHINGFTQKLIVDDTEGAYVSMASDNDIIDATWKRVIIVSDDATSTTRMYINGTLQAAVGAFRTGGPTNWGGSSTSFGATLNGAMADMAFAYTATGFSAGDLTDVDAALAEYIG
jgi:hypothetical protein